MQLRCQRSLDNVNLELYADIETYERGAWQVTTSQLPASWNECAPFSTVASSLLYEKREAASHEAYSQLRACLQLHELLTCCSGIFGFSLSVARGTPGSLGTSLLSKWSDVSNCKLDSLLAI